MSLAKLLTRQIVRGELPVEEAQQILLASARRKDGPNTLAQIIGHAIESALQRNDHNVYWAAKELHVSKDTIYRWLRRVNPV